MATSAPSFSLADLEAHDPKAMTLSGSECRFLCPICGDTKPKDNAHRSLCANTVNGAWVCKRCEAKGKLTDFWTDNTDSGPQARVKKREFARRKSEQFFKIPEPAEPPESETAGTWRDQLQGERVLDATTAETYLQSRGINIEVAKASGAVYAPKFYGRPSVVFPICDRDGQQTGVSGRYFHPDATPKTRIAGTKKNGLFATVGALSSDTIIITEAPIDALSIATAGYAAVALCGTSAPNWVHLACGLKRVVLAFDADRAGDKAAEALEAFISPFGARCERLRPEDTKDWNEALQCDSDALSAMLAHALGDVKEIDTTDVYERARAYGYANRLFRMGRINQEQRDNLQRYALRA